MMYRPTFLTLCGALPLALISTSALADLQAAQVWTNWKSYMQGMGYSVQAQETADGDDLSVSDVEMSMAFPEGAGNMVFSMGTVRFVQNGAAVDVVLPGTMPMVLEFAPGDDKPVKIGLSLSQTGHALKVSGAPEDMRYDYSADSFNFALDSLEVGGETFGAQNASASISGTGVQSVTTVQIGALRNYTQTGGIDALSYDVDILSPEDGSRFDISGTLDGMRFDGTGAIPTAFDPGEFAAMLKAGFAVAGSFDYARGNADFALSSPDDGDFTYKTSSSGGTFAVRMDQNALGYSGEQTGVDVALRMSQVPLPIDMSMARGAFNLLIPIAQSDAPQDFEVGFTLADFTMSDGLWSLFDPTAQLPRDPATIDLALNGQAKLLIDILDPESMASATGTPGELNALTISRFLVDAVGARLEATGDFTFDNTDLATFGGMPKPVGAIDVSLAGANALIDKLIAMGILPEEQAMGARMMMGMFAVPGDAPDTLKSRVEFTADGQVLANGQRIR